MRPVGRGHWLAGRLAVALGLLALGAASATLGTWAAGSVTGLGVASADLLAAGLNVLPAAVFILGVGTLLHGFVPRLAIPLTYALVVGSFLLEVVGSTVDLPEAVLNLSVLHHVAPAPAVEPDWASAGVMVALGALLALAGILALGRRDVEPA
jgi:ABC-2 type transport system permease protein